jgi:PAS domain S-box-containing protein
MNFEQISHTSDLQSLEASIDGFPIPIFLIEVENEKTFRYRKLNKAHTLATGMDSGEIAGKTPEEFFPPRFAETVSINYSRCLNSRGSYRFEEVLSMPAREMYWDTILTPVFNDDKIIGILGIAFDITHLKQTEKYLFESLEVTNREKNDLRILSNTIAHDLRAPLRQIGMIKDLVLKDFTDLGDNKLQLLNKGKDIIENALAQLDEVMRQAKKDKPQTGLMSDFEFGKWCLDIIALLDPLKKYDFVYPSASLHCEKFVLDIVMRNLIDNACKHANGEVAVDVKTVKSNLIFTVRDDGPGFSPVHFTAGEPPSGPAVEDDANGFGLEASKRLIEARGGELWIEETAERGRGGVVSFRIPGKILEPDSKFFVMRAS